MTSLPPCAASLPPAALLEALVRIPSPTGQEADAVAWLQGTARLDGFRVEEDEAGNFIAECGQGGDAAPLLWFVGHIDTVPGDLPVETRDGALWGRGSVDAKGPLVAAYCAARACVGKEGLRVRIIGCVDEEGGSRGARALPKDASPDWIVVGEPNQVDGFALGYKGVVRGLLDVDQPRLHASAPGTGACERVWSAWQRILDSGPKGDGFGDIHCRIVSFEGGETGARDKATARFDIRIPPGLSTGDAVEMVRAAADPVHVHILETCPAATSSPRTGLAAAFRSAIRAEGGTPVAKHKTATADYNLLRQWYPDVPALVYGPGDSHLDHGPEEHIVLAQLEAAVRVWGRVLETLATAGRP